MTTRRNLIMAGACFGAGALAYGLKPRKQISLLGAAKMETIVPVNFPGWSAEVSEGVVKPKAEGLAAELYSEIVQRTYRGEKSGADVMLLIAYGGLQSDLLQLHRPEVCYPALGFQIRSMAEDTLKLPGGSSLPVVRLVAEAGDRRENVVYWTRVGEALPTNNTDQRSILLQTSLKGLIPDGVLVRSSIVHDDVEEAFATLDGFIPTMLAAIPASNRRALIGTEPAKVMRLAGV